MAVFGSLETANALHGSIYMALFGLGTIPLMTLAIYLGSFLSNKVRQYITKAIPVFVVFLGILFILRGLGLGIPYVSPTSVNQTIDAHYECH